MNIEKLKIILREIFLPFARTDLSNATIDELRNIIEYESVYSQKYRSASSEIRRRYANLPSSQRSEEIERQDEISTAGQRRVVASAPQTTHKMMSDHATNMELGAIQEPIADTNLVQHEPSVEVITGLIDQALSGEFVPANPFLRELAAVIIQYGISKANLVFHLGAQRLQNLESWLSGTVLPSNAEITRLASRLKLSTEARAQLKSAWKTASRATKNSTAPIPLVEDTTVPAKIHQALKQAYAETSEFYDRHVARLKKTAEPKSFASADARIMKLSSSDIITAEMVGQELTIFVPGGSVIGGRFINVIITNVMVGSSVARIKTDFYRRYKRAPGTLDGEHRRSRLKKPN